MSFAGIKHSFIGKNMWIFVRFFNDKKSKILAFFSENELDFKVKLFVKKGVK